MKRLDANMKHIMLLALVALLAAQGGCAQEDGLYPAASITSMQPADGSAGGGVRYKHHVLWPWPIEVPSTSVPGPARACRLVLTGVFQDVHDGDNKVFIGSYPCEVSGAWKRAELQICLFDH